jgi:beta-lactamase regulating signal transducer with metallopeptidase domain
MVEDWQQWAAPGAAWVLTYLIHSTLLIALVWLISRRLDGRPAALDRLWKTALVGGLLTATLQTAADVSPVGGQLDLSASSASTTKPEIQPAENLAFAPLADAEIVPDGAELDADEAVVSPAPGTEKRSKRAAKKSARKAAERARAGYPASGQPASGQIEALAMEDRQDAEATPSPSAVPSAALDAVTSAVPSDVDAADPEDVAALGAIHGSGPDTGSPAGNGASAGPETSAGRGVWLAAGFLAWALLAAFFGAGMIRSWSRLRRVLADRRPIEAGPASTMLARLAAGTLPRVRLSASTRVDVPIAVGVLRPEIVVPERALYQLEPAELETMLAHELAHLVRRDPAWRLITGFMHRVLFLQPLNRVAAVHLESASEVLCDDWAVERTDRPLALARCLTEVAGWVASPLGASVPAMARRGSGLGRRVRRLVAADDDPSPRRRDRWPVPFAAGALTLVVFAAPGATEMASSSPPEAMPPAPNVVAASVSPGEVVPERSPAAAPAPDKKGDARRLLEKLRGGPGGTHDLSDWVALAQLLGSPEKGQALRVDDESDAVLAGGAPMFSADDLADLIGGSISRALGGTGVDVDFDVDTGGRFDIQVNGIDVLALVGGNVDEGEGFDVDFDVAVPDIDIDIEVPEPPEPPEPPDAECDDDDHGASAHLHQHPSGLSREQVRELQRQAHEIARQAREHARHARQQARRAYEQARHARDQALRQAARARRHAHRQARVQRDHALRQAHEARRQALRQAHQAREQALRQAHQAREQALRAGRQAREQAMRAHAEAMRQHERAMREAERERRRAHEEQMRRIERERSQQ